MFVFLILLPFFYIWIYFLFLRFSPDLPFAFSWSFALPFFLLIFLPFPLYDMSLFLFYFALISSSLFATVPLASFHPVRSISICLSRLPLSLFLSVSTSEQIALTKRLADIFAGRIWTFCGGSLLSANTPKQTRRWCSSTERWSICKLPWSSWRETDQSRLSLRRERVEKRCDRHSLFGVLSVCLFFRLLWGKMKEMMFASLKESTIVQIRNQKWSGSICSLFPRWHKD